MLHIISGSRRMVSRLFSNRSRAVFGALLFLLLAAPLPAAAQRGVNISYLADATAAMSINEAASPEKSGEYRGYVPSFMAFSRLPGDFNGAVWLRFALDANFEKPVGALRLDLDTALPGITRLFIPQKNGSFNVMESAPHSGAFSLPEEGPFPEVFYVRVDGTPGLWFRPAVGAEQDASPLPPLNFILAGLFALGMLVLLVQYIRKAEEWRVWAAVTAGCGIVAAILPSIPVAGAAFTPLMAAVMLMPGLILVLFIHTVRHLFDSPRTMPGFDNLLVLMYLVGGIAALVPLVPGFLWTSRYLPLFPILLLPLLPLGMVALARSLRGCSLFFCASLLPVAGVAASAWELTAPEASHLAGTGGLWGMGLAILLISFVTPDKAKAEADDEEDVFDSLNRSHSLTLHKKNAAAEPAPETGTAVPPEVPFLTETPAAEKDAAWPSMMPEERRPEPAAIPEEEYPALSLFDDHDAEPEPVPAPAPDMPEDAPVATPEAALPIPDSALEKYPSVWADALPEPATGPDRQPPMDMEPDMDAAPVADVSGTELSGATPASGMTSAPGFVPEPSSAPAEPAAQVALEPSLPVEAPAPAATMTADAPRVQILAGDANDTPELPLEAADNVQPLFGEPTREAPAAGTDDPAPAGERRSGRRMLFNLPLLIKNTYDILSPLCEDKNIGMTWFIAPQTGSLFEGEAELLESALRLLLRDMVESVECGNVRLNVRRLPDSVEGHLVFTIVEWDAKQVTHERKIAGVAEAWALAEKTGGIFSVEHSPGNGTTVIFSAVFTAMDKPSAAGEAPAAPMRHPSGTAPAAEKHAVPDTAPAAPASVPAPVIQVFADYPDIATPEADNEALAISAPSVPAMLTAPTGIDGDGLLEEDGTERDPHRIIVADIAASSRAKAAGIFAGTPYSVMECASPADAHALYQRHPSAVVVMNADMPEVDIIAAIKDIRADDAACGRTPAHAVALVGYAVQAERMMQAGCSHAVLKNMMEDELLSVVENLAPVSPAAAKDSEAAPVPAAPAPHAAEETVEPEALATLAVPAEALTVAPNTEGAPIMEAPTPETLLDVALADIPSMESEAGPTNEPQIISGDPAFEADARHTEAPAYIAASGIFATALPPEVSETDGPKTGETAGESAPKHTGGLGLLDMIIRDEEEQEYTPGVAVPFTNTEAAPEPAADAQADPSVEETPAAPATKEPESKQLAQEKPRQRGVRVVVRAASSTGSLSSEEKPVQPEAAPDNARPAPAATVTPQAPENAEPAPVLGEEAVSQVRQLMETLQASATVPASIPLPGEEDSVFKDMAPLIPGLVVELTDAMNDAARGRAEKSPMLVQEAAERVAGKAESFGLTRLERMARCVERAAAADDVEPMECVLADLEAWVDRYKDALLQLHREVQW